MHRESPTAQRWLLALLALATTAVFLVLHPYRGLIHDARLYTIQALNRLHPELYGNDIFLRLGSQDDYTLFSFLHAWTISWIGVEPAAAVVTLCSILLFLAAYWMLARSLLPTEQAAIALLLIMLVPAYYGPARVFHYIEEFATPRQLAEALALLCLTAWLSGKRILAVVLGGVAMLVHPIIGLAGVMFVPVLEWITPRWRKLWPLAALAVLLTTLAIMDWLPISRWQFDAQWYQLVMNRTYLGLLNWNSEDWARVATVFATLATAGIALRDRLQLIATTTFITSGLLLLLALVGGDLLRIVIVVQAQTWRALWLATVLAVLLLPPLFVRGWYGSALTRCALLLLAAAWAAPHGILALVTAPLAVVSMAFSSRQLSPREDRMLLWGCWAMLCIAVIHSLAIIQLAWNEELTVLETLPPLLQKLTLLGENSVLPALLLLGGGLLAFRFPSCLMIKTLTAAAAITLATVAYPLARTWTATYYSNTLHESFGPWRALIPPGSEVLWIDSNLEDAAINTWLLLERPSFISITQAPNALFSRQAAIEMAERASSLTGLLPFSNPFRPGEKPKMNTSPLLGPVCGIVKARYIVTDENLADATPILAPTSAHSLLRDNKLYICP